MIFVGGEELDGDLGVVVQLDVVVRVGADRRRCTVRCRSIGDVVVQLPFCYLYVLASTHTGSEPGERDDRAFSASFDAATIALAERLAAYLR